MVSLKSGIIAPFLPPFGIDDVLSLICITMIPSVDKNVDVLAILPLHDVSNDSLLVIDIQFPAIFATNKIRVLLFIDVLVLNNGFIKILL